MILQHYHLTITYLWDRSFGGSLSLNNSFFHVWAFSQNVVKFGMRKTGSLVSMQDEPFPLYYPQSESDHLPHL